MFVRWTLGAIVAFGALTVGCSPDEASTPSSAATTVAATDPASASAASASAATSLDAAATTASARAAGRVISVVVADGKVTPEPAAVDLRLGSTVMIEVTADVDDEVHVHGYDKKVDVQSGVPTRLQLVLDVPGQFEVELESARQELFTLRVR